MNILSEYILNECIIHVHFKCIYIHECHKLLKNERELCTRLKYIHLESKITNV